MANLVALDPPRCQHRSGPAQCPATATAQLESANRMPLSVYCPEHAPEALARQNMIESRLPCH